MMAVQAACEASRTVAVLQVTLGLLDFDVIRQVALEVVLRVASLNLLKKGEVCVGNTDIVLTAIDQNAEQQ